MCQVYSSKQFRIYTADKEYIVLNINKPFENGHTHIADFNTAKYIVKLARTLIIPKHLSKYLTVSLIRISEDTEYIESLEKLLEDRK